MPRRFSAQRATIDNQLRILLKGMGAEGLRVEEEFTNPGITVSFRRGPRWYTLTCNKYQHPLDNYRAVHLTIDYLYRALELYGVTREEAEQAPLHRRKEAAQRAEEQFETMFLPFTATPTDLPKLRLGDGNAPWWEVLGTTRDATPQAIRLAYLALARLQHPDSGGDNATMQRINHAYAEAMRERGVA